MFSSHPRICVVRKLKFPMNHVALYFEGRGVFENSPDHGKAAWVSWEQFNRNGDARVAREVQVQDYWLVLQRIENMIQSGERYSIFGFNCEHAVSQALTGRRESPQLVGSTVLAVLAVAVVALA